MIDIFIPSYHRPKNIKTAKFLSATATMQRKFMSS